MRTSWVEDSSLVPVTDGGVAVKISTTDVSNAAGFWHYNSGAQQIEARNADGTSSQVFTVRVRLLDDAAQAVDVEDDDAVDFAEEEAEADAQEAVLIEAFAADECLPVA
eukprot:tig00000057_g34.t1